MSALLRVELIGANHGPRGAAHLVILAAIVVIALVFFGVRRWQAKRASTKSHSTDDDQA